MLRRVPIPIMSLMDCKLDTVHKSWLLLTSCSASSTQSITSSIQEHVYANGMLVLTPDVVSGVC